MKKITAIISAFVLLSAFTACSSGEMSQKTAPDGEINVVDVSDTPAGLTESTTKQEERTEPEETENAKKTEEPAKPKDTSKQEEPFEPAWTGALVEFPPGSYFTKDGKPCADHSGCSWTSDDCNCISFDRSIQAFGFAKYVYFKYNGKHVSEAEKTEKDEDITAASAKDYIMGLPAGTYLSVETARKGPHAMIVADTSESGIKVCQANYGGGCVVSVKTFTWEEFAKQFPHLNYCTVAQYKREGWDI